MKATPVKRAAWTMKSRAGRTAIKAARSKAKAPLTAESSVVCLKPMMEA